MNVGWRVLAQLPRAELTRLSRAQVEAHLGPESAARRASPAASTDAVHA
jgi:vacuolar-type H+-ATPase subunit B/Vma2